MSIFLAILGLAALVLVHEAGHFFIALATRMRPRRFYVGFPPAVAKIKRRGIEYGIGAIPLGGYVKIPGMFRPGRRDTELYFGSAIEEDGSLGPPVERLSQALESGDLDAARAGLGELRTDIEQAKLPPGPTRVAHRGVEELDDALSSDAYWRQPTWKRLVVIAAGPVTNILLAVVVFAVLYTLDAYRLGFERAANREGDPTTRVERVLPDTPAERAGLLKGDVIVRVNGVRVNGDTITEEIGNSRGGPISLAVRRDGELQRLTAVEPTNLADSPLAALGESVGLTWRITRDIFVDGLGRLFVGKGHDQISSPVGIVQGSSDAYKHGIADFLFVVALISLSLGILNLLPLLPLDGGHLAFSLIEHVRGRALSREIYERVSGVGIAFVLLLFVLGLSNDIGRL